MISMSGCKGGSAYVEIKSSQARIAIKNAMTDPSWFFTYMEESPKPLSDDDIAYLGEQLVSEDDRVRGYATCILAESGNTEAAALIFLAAQDEDERNVPVWNTMILSLGRMGDVGEPFLVRLLKKKGLSPSLQAALAQANGVKPQENSHFKSGRSAYLEPWESVEWWKSKGMQKYAKSIKGPSSKFSQ